MGIGNPNFNPIRPNSSVQPSSGAGENSGKSQINNPDTQNVIQSLGFSNTTQQVNVTKGLADNMMLKLVELNQEKVHLLKSLGIEHLNVDMIIAFAAENQIDTIKKKLKSVKDSIKDRVKRGQLLNILGLDEDDENHVFQDEEGGVYILESFLKEVESSLDK